MKCISHQKKKKMKPQKATRRTKILYAIAGTFWMIMGWISITSSNSMETFVNIPWRLYGMLIFIIGMLILEILFLWNIPKFVLKLLRDYIVSIVKEETR